MKRYSIYLDQENNKMKNKEEFKKRESLITFRGQQMKLSEGRNLLDKIMEGSITLELTKQERVEYEDFNASIKRDNQRRKKMGNKDLSEEISEKNYIAFLLSIPVTIKERFEKQEYCRINGHNVESVLSTDSSGKALCYCSSCGDMYDRNMTYEERKEFNKIAKTPMTI